MAAPVILVEAQPRRIADGTPVTVRLAGGGAMLPYHYGDQHYRAGITGLPRSIASLDFDGQQLGGGGVAQALQLSWAPADRAGLTEMAALYWADAAITVRIGPEGALPPMSSAGLVLETAVQDGLLSIALADNAVDLKRPLLVDRYAGTGGVEGPVEFEGQIKSRAWGRCFNVPGKVIDAANNIWVFGDPLRAWGAFDEVRDSGVAPDASDVVRLGWQGSPQATFAALQAAAAPEGGGVYAASIACVKWWSEPLGDLHADIRGETAGGYVETAPEIVARIVAARSTIAFAPGALAAAAAVRSAPCGWRVDSDATTAAEAISELLGDVSLSWPMIDGAIVFRAWDWTAPVRVARSHKVSRKSTIKPVGTRKLGYRRNWAPMARGDLAAIVLVRDVVYEDGTSLETAIENAGKTAEWPSISDPDGKKPDDNATNSADPNSPFGEGKVAEAVATLKRVEPLAIVVADLEDARDRLDTAVDGIRHDTDAAGAALAALDDTVADVEAANRQFTRDAGRLSDAALQVLLIANRTQEMIRDAGIVVDPATGIVRIYAVDRAAERIAQAEIVLDAQKALITTKASSAEVDAKILAAVLSPEQVAQLEPLLARLAAVEVVQDGLRGELRTKAELVELTRALARLSEAETTISATDALVRSKVSQAAFEQAVARIATAETTIQAYGDISRYQLDLRQARMDLRETGAGLLASVLAGNDVAVRQITAQAALRQELYTKIIDDVGAEARARLTLAVAVGQLDARSVQDRLVLVQADKALAQDIDGLRATNDRQESSIATLRQASVDATGGITLLGTTLRQQARGARDASATELAAVLAGDDAARRINDSLAEVQTQLTTTVAGFAAAASARQALRARIDAADARFTQEATATADRFRAVTQLVTALEAEFGRQNADIVAARAEITALARTTSEADAATAETISGLRAIVNDPATGLGKTRAELTALTQAVTTQNAAAVRRLEGLEAAVSDPATGLAATIARLDEQIRLTASQDAARGQQLDALRAELRDPTSGLPAVFAAVAAERDASVGRDQANARSVQQVTARLNGVGGVTIEDAIEAVVDKIGRIVGTRTVAIDINGNMVGTQLVGSTEGPGSFNLINTDFRMGTGRVIMNNGGYMWVQGIGFGAEGKLIDWYGPTMAIAQCATTNAIAYKTNDGRAVFRGSNGNAPDPLSITSSQVGQNQLTSPAWAKLATIDRIGASFSWTNSGGRWGAAIASQSPPEVTIVLYRKLGSASEVEIERKTVQGYFASFGTKDPDYFDQGVSAVINYADTDASTEPRIWRLAASLAFSIPGGSSPQPDDIGQTMTITSTPQ